MTTGDRLSLAPASASPSAARRWLADQLAGYPENMVADAALLVSEVVTNAVLHAGTAIEVAAVHAREGVRVEVADGSTVVPNAKGYIADAATGRGLMLLEAMASAWGVEVRPSGKVVWFDMAAPAGTDASERGADPEAWPDLDGWPDLNDWPDLDGAPVELAAGIELVDVRLVGFPLGLLKTTSEQYDALFRELRLILEHAEGEAHAIPRRLMALSDELAGQYSSFTVSSDAELRAAQERGDETVDITYHLPRDVGRASAHYDELLDEADRWCRAGRELLTLAPKPAAVALRKWLLGEFVRQCAGEPPCPWPDSPWARGLH